MWSAQCCCCGAHHDVPHSQTRLPSTKDTEEALLTSALGDDVQKDTQKRDDD
jgi:hypothetical protein